MRGHPPPRAVLERRRRVERVERGQAPAARGGQDAVGGERLVQMQDVGLLEERRRRLPRLLHRVPQEAEQRAPAGGELDDVGQTHRQRLLLTPLPQSLEERVPVHQHGCTHAPSIDTGCIYVKRP